MSKSKSVWFVVPVVALALAGCHEAKGHDHGESAAPAAKAGEPPAVRAHEHGHDHGGAPATLKLDDGKKWHTDDSLRAGMTAIRNDVQAALDPIHEGKYTPEDYEALGEKIDAHVQTIMSKCKLPPAVDAQIHVVLSEIFAGTSMMKKDGNRMGGAVKIIKALGSYADTFEHPGWQPIKH
ncbi:MAG: hypothetical protein HYV09_34935 [Deltaproteobacteria bacterium]|nr:hypothetical protein [Deltaproteobacteria bacterium]